MRTTAVLTLRNEAGFLLEWLAHHRACGISDFLVFSNDCEDGTGAMLDRLQDMGWLTHVPQAGPFAEGPQWAALKAADRHPLVRNADWLLVIDVDEFVNIHVGDRTLAALWSALPQATALPLTWRLFGNAGVVQISDRPVTESFQRAAPSALHWPWRAALFKTLFRNDGCYGKLGVHRPRQPQPGRLDRSVWVDGSGRALPDAYRTGRIFSALGQDNHALVQLNHYALGSMQGYLVKCDRGRANREGQAFDMGYWAERNFCDIEDATILALDSRGIRAELLADPVLGPLHRQGVAWRQTRFALLMQEEPWRALFGRLLMTPPARVLSSSQARQIWQHGPAGG